MIRFLMLAVVLVFASVDALFAATTGGRIHADELARVLLIGSGGGSVAVAALGTSALTLADWAKRLDPDGTVPTIVELLSQSNEMLMDMRFKEGNLPVGHRSTVRTGLPSVAWRLLNQAVTPSKSSTAQVDFQTGILEAWSEVDPDLARLNGNVKEFRLSEGMAFIEAMNQEMAQTVIYGNQGLAPEEFTGLSPMYSAISGATNASNVISGGGSQSDNTSIWFAVWGDRGVFGLFPKGSKAGLQHDDYGEVTIQGSTGIGGSRMRAMQERWQWKAGLALEDWRQVVRICNIDVSSLIANAGAQANLLLLMTKAYHRIKSLNAGSPAIYMNRTVAEFLDVQDTAAVSTGGGITFENVDGRRRGSFRGIPIRIVDAILETEATVT